MERSAELEWIRRYLAHLAAGTTELAPDSLHLSAAVYSGEAHWAGERAALCRQPSVACLSAELPEPGCLLSFDATGVPLFVARQPGGGVRAFVNACRHRGSPLVEGRERAAGGRIRCPFHSWTYDLAGSLCARPQAESALASLEPAGLGLLERPCAEADGLVLVRAQGDAPIDPAVALRGIEADLRVIGLDSYHLFATRASHWRCNWKLLLATFLESYHVFSLHRETVDPWYFSHPMVHDAWGSNIRFPVARRTIETLAERPEQDWCLADHATIQWLVGANTLLSYTRDYVLRWSFVSPEPNRCNVTTSLFSREPAHTAEQRERLDAAFDLQLRVTGAEDFPAQQRIQSVLDSGALPEVVVAANEVAVVAFHRALDELLGDGAGSGR
jgi:phenylpropionate dioxygenase-like ring-hydroxylating dioxygenase large terminal subunit